MAKKFYDDYLLVGDAVWHRQITAVGEAFRASVGHQADAKMAGQ
jgi:hypothetical protein